MDQSEMLHKLAAAMIVAEGRVPLDAVGVTAVDLLTELYAVGVAHGIAPEDWAAVTSLPLACLDVTRAQARRHRPISNRAAQMGEGQPPLRRTVEPVRNVDQPGRGRAR
jgi:hypothetical protein